MRDDALERRIWRDWLSYRPFFPSFNLLDCEGAEVKFESDRIFGRVLGNNKDKYVARRRLAR